MVTALLGGERCARVCSGVQQDAEALDSSRESAESLEAATFRSAFFCAPSLFAQHRIALVIFWLFLGVSFYPQWVSIMLEPKLTVTPTSG
jgi:hypothetical protein